MDSLDEDVLAIGRARETAIDGGFAEQRDGAAGGIHQCQLRQSVIIKQLFIVRTLEDVARLVGAAWPSAAGALLHIRSFGSFSGRWRRTASVGHQPHEKGLLVRHPLDGGTQPSKNAIQTNPLQS